MIGLIKWVANSMVEYSAFNRFVPGSNPGQSIEKGKLRSNIYIFKLYKVAIL